ncbi:ABC transporter permease [Rhizobium sp. NLR17b]|uniref:ABC transporter permease n=1 Tax=Rhizobium sp. NLR17b TaxID=2731114 RepID=UPI001C83E908|nr:ABC transporter permease [Rhizobium sp. NLR17b]MBX5272672.1 ABC transporter permease [Rhizobium sp. NLR17b]
MDGATANPSPRTAQPEGENLARRLATSLLRMRELSVAVVCVGIAIYFASSNAAFYSGQNLSNISDLAASVIIVAAGQVMLLVCGEIDLSVGMTFAFIPLVMMALNDLGMPLEIAFLAAMGLAVLIGFVNGYLTITLKLPSFLTTLGMMFLLEGLTLKLSNSYPRNAPSDGLLVNVLGGWSWSAAIWAVSIVLVMQIVLTSTKWGAYTVATGCNAHAASEAGINIRGIKVRAFVLTAVLGGLAGIIEGIHITQSYSPLAGGTDLMFKTVTAAVIGGTALLGGSGTVVGALFGALVLAMLQNGFTLQGISATTFILIQGVAILIAMSINTYLTRFRRESKVA